MPRLKPPFFPAAKGLYLQPTIVNNVETLSNLPWIIINGGDAFTALGAEASKGTRMFAVSGPRQPARRVRGASTASRRSASSSTRPCTGGGIRGGHAAQGVHPRRRVGAVVLPRSTSTCRSRSRRVDKAGSMLGSGAIVVMDDTTDAVKACLRVVRFFARESLRQVHAVPRGHELAREDPAAHPRRPRPARATSTCCSTCATTSAPASPGRPGRPRSARSARRPPRPSPRRSSASATSSRPTSTATVESRSTRRRPSRRPRRCLTRRPRHAEPDQTTVHRHHRRPRHRGQARASCSSTPPSAHGIYIPRFCYHPRMEPVGMCRMCLVEVDTGRGPGAAAVLHDRVAPEHEGRHRLARSPRRRRTGVLEFLLINHPLDCPVCDKGGECPLQDQTMAYGPGESRFVEEKRHYEKPIPISDLVLPRPRALHPLRPLHPLRQGGGRRPADPLHQPRQRDRRSTPSPTSRSRRTSAATRCRSARSGALTAKPYRFKARPWDLEQVESPPARRARSGCRIVDRVEPRTRCCATRASTSTRSTGAGCATRAASTSRRSNSDDRLGAPRCVPRRATSSSRRPLGRGARRRRRRHPRGRRRAAGPTSVGRARRRPPAPTRTPTPGPSWPRASSAPTTSTPSSATACRPRSCSACPGHHRRGVRAGGTVVLLGPDLKEELPVLYLRLRHAGARTSASACSSWPSTTPASRAGHGVVALPARRDRRAHPGGASTADRCRRGRRRSSGRAAGDLLGPVR